MRVLVTVGTTAFDDLIAVVCSDEFCSTLISSGYYELVVQSGNSKLPSFLTQAKSNEKNLRIVHFTFKDSLEQYFKEADLVISHAGAGSLMQAVRNLKPTIAVINESLLDNHQAELSYRLQEEGYVLALCPHELLPFFKEQQKKALPLYHRVPPPFPSPRKADLVNLIDQEMGFSG